MVHSEVMDLWTDLVAQPSRSRYESYPARALEFDRITGFKSVPSREAVSVGVQANGDCDVRDEENWWILRRATQVMRNEAQSEGIEGVWKFIDTYKRHS